MELRDNLNRLRKQNYSVFDSSSAEMSRDSKLTPAISPPTVSVYARYHLIFRSHRNLDPNKGYFNQIGRVFGCFDLDHTVYDLEEGAS